MTYQGIEYSICASLGREAWILTFSPRRGQVINGRYVGTRDGALRAVHQAIDRWRERHPNAKGLEASKIQTETLPGSPPQEPQGHSLQLKT